VKEKDVQEYVEDLRARFYGELENVLIAVMQYVKNGKDGGLLGYRMLVDAGVIPQKVGKQPSSHGTAKASGPAARQRTASDKDDRNGDGKPSSRAPAILCRTAAGNGRGGRSDPF
jgi:hypothetical protein